MITPEVLARATEIAQKIIDAYGKNPAEYDAREQQALSAFTFGAEYTYYFDEAKATASEFKALMMALFNTKFHYDLKVTESYIDFLTRCTKKGYHSSMYAAIHLGMDAYSYLNRREQLNSSLLGMMRSLRTPDNEEEKVTAAAQRVNDIYINGMKPEDMDQRTWYVIAFVEEFMDKYRSGGRLAGLTPIFFEFDAALYDGLLKAGFASNYVSTAIREIRAEQSALGFTQDSKLPKVPEKILFADASDKNRPQKPSQNPSTSTGKTWWSKVRGALKIGKKDASASRSEPPAIERPPGDAPSGGQASLTKEVLARATEIAQKIIDAYGKDPAEYDAREQQALSAFAYGSVFTYYFEEVAGIPPKLQTMAEFQALMMMVFNRQFLYDLNVAGQYFGFLLNCTKKGYHPSMYAVIHLGIDGYDFLDKPEQLREGLHGMIKA